MKQITLPTNSLHRADFLADGLVESVLADAKAALRRWHRRNAQRRDPARLSPRQLDDIGITDAEYIAEVGNFSWRG